jgi:hypothetical protein
MRRWQQRGRLGVVAAASFVLLVLVLPQVATGIGLGGLASRLADSASCGSGSGSSGSGFSGIGSGSGSSGPCGPLTVTAVPDTRLADAQEITVTGSGFSANTSIGIAECKAGATGQAGCDFSTLLDTTSNGSGSFTTLYSVSRLITTSTAKGSGAVTETTDCAVDPCILGAADTSDMAMAAVTPIRFNPRIPPVFRDTVAGADTVDVATGVADIAGTFICRRPLTVDIFVDLDQHRGRFNFENEGDAFLTCSGHKKWSATVEPGIGLFGPGKATVNVAMATAIGNSYRDIVVSGTITLKAVTSR